MFIKSLKWITTTFYIITMLKSLIIKSQTVTSQRRKQAQIERGDRADGKHKACLFGRTIGWHGPSLATTHVERDQ